MNVPKSLWSKTVRELDNNRCVFCGATERLEAHHIKPQHSNPELANELENGITLCKKCHYTAHNGDYTGKICFTDENSSVWYPESFSVHPAKMNKFIEHYVESTEIMYAYIPRKKAREFRNACKQRGTTPNIVLQQVVTHFLEDFRKKQMN